MPPVRTNHTGVSAELPRNDNEQSASAQVAPGAQETNAPVIDATEKNAGVGLLVYEVIEPRSHYTLPEPKNEDKGHTAEELAALEITCPPPANGFVVAKATWDVVDKYNLEAARRNQDIFSMHVYNKFNGDGLQEVIENQFVAFTALMKEKEPDAIKLWIHLSGLAHWTTVVDLGMWMMQGHGDRWRDTAAMIGWMTVTTLNALERAGLLGKDTPVKDLGFVLAIIGMFLKDCVSMTGDVPAFASKPDDEVWPYIIVDYATRHGIEITGVYNIDKDFVKKYDDAFEANSLKKKQAVDRWGWKTKYSYMVKNYRRGARYGGTEFDIFKMTPRKRIEASFGGGKDPLDPNNPRNVLKMFGPPAKE